MSKLKEDHTTQKNYSYKIDDVSLTFSLKTDDAKTLVAFQEILHAALEEVTKDIEEMSGVNS